MWGISLKLQHCKTGSDLPKGSKVTAQQQTVTSQYNRHLTNGPGGKVNYFTHITTFAVKTGEWVSPVLLPNLFPNIANMWHVWNGELQWKGRTIAGFINNHSVFKIPYCWESLLSTGWLRMHSLHRRFLWVVEMECFITNDTILYFIFLLSSCLFISLIVWLNGSSL